MSDLSDRFHGPDSDDNDALAAAERLRGIVQSLSKSCVEQIAQNPVHAMLILTQAASGILHLLARAVMQKNSEHEPVNSTATLFAALASYQVAPCEVELGRVHCEFSPLVLNEALKDMEKLTGQRPDHLLNDTMCQVARECAADPAVVAYVQKQRSNLVRGGASLN